MAHSYRKSYNAAPPASPFTPSVFESPRGQLALAGTTIDGLLGEAGKTSTSSLMQYVRGAKGSTDGGWQRKHVVFEGADGYDSRAGPLVVDESSIRG